MTTAFNDAVITEFRNNNGAVARFEPRRLILLHTRGARSGSPAVNPLIPLIREHSDVVFAGNAGAQHDPDWCHNLRSHPDTHIESVLGNQIRHRAVRARELHDDELAAAHSEFIESYPAFVDYIATAAPRVIPAFELTALRASGDTTV